MSMQALEANKLEKGYRGRKIVRGVSLQVRSGEVVGLLGPNGAGKTTTFYMVVGLVRPDQGRVVLDGTDITKMPMYQRARKASVICPGTIGVQEADGGRNRRSTRTGPFGDGAYERRDPDDERATHLVNSSIHAFRRRRRRGNSPP
jgi:ABC-type glutathione transport system ATPase component